MKTKEDYDNVITEIRNLLDEAETWINYIDKAGLFEKASSISLLGRYFGMISGAAIAIYYNSLMELAPPEVRARVEAKDRTLKNSEGFCP